MEVLGDLVALGLAANGDVVAVGPEADLDAAAVLGERA